MTDEKPFFAIHAFFCTNKRPDGHPRGCCLDKGSEDLRNYMKVRAKELGLADTRINSAGCLDRCELGPVMVIYPDGIWYAPKTRDDVDLILSQHLAGGTVVDHLRLSNEQR